jgi:hypothetical protein
MLWKDSLLEIDELQYVSVLWFGRAKNRIQPVSQSLSCLESGSFRRRALCLCLYTKYAMVVGSQPECNKPPTPTFSNSTVVVMIIHESPLPSLQRQKIEIMLVNGRKIYFARFELGEGIISP